MTETIAQIAGPYLLVTGFGFLVSNDFYARMVAGTAKTDPVTLNLSGAVHFVIGMIIVVNHFAWSTPLEAVVTLLGLAAVAKGAGLIALPDLTVRSSVPGTKGLRISGIAFVAVGLYLSVMGYGRFVWE